MKVSSSPFGRFSSVSRISLLVSYSRIFLTCKNTQRNLHNTAKSVGSRLKTVASQLTFHLPSLREFR